VAALALLIALVAVAREVGLGFQLPTSGLADERVYVEHVRAFQSDVEDRAALPGAATYPYLVSKLALATWRMPECKSPDVADHLAAASSLEKHLRRVVAWLSLLAIPAMWLLVRAFSSRATALLAAALCGTSLFAQAFAQEGRPHGAFYGLSLLALALAVQLQRRTTFAFTVLAGTVAGLAFAALQSGIAMLVPVAVAILLGRGVGLRRRCTLLMTAALPSCVALVWAYPYLFVDHVDPSVQKGHALLGEGRLSFAMLDGSGFSKLADALWTYEPLGVVVAMVAVGVCIASALPTLWSRAQRRTDAGERSAANPFRLDPRTWNDPVRSAAVVASYVVPYVVLFGLYERTYTRYALPLTPFLAWLGAWLLTPRASRVRTWYAWVPAALLLGAQAALVAKLAYVRCVPDTLEQAARWIEREGLPNARIGLLPSDDLPLLRLPQLRAALRPRFSADPWRHWLAYQVRLGPGPWDEHARDIFTPWDLPPEQFVSAMIAGGADYCVLRTFEYLRPRGFETVRRDLEQHGKLVATFWPVDEPEKGPFPTRDEYEMPKKYGPWILRLVKARASGNLVEVWQLRG
jgi:hypothetical protein